MDDDDSDLARQPWSAKCVCGKRFLQPNSYALHVGCCTQFKHRLGERLKDARRRQMEDVPSVERHHLHLSRATDAPIREGMSRPGKRKKPSWIDEDNLDIDVVIPQISKDSGNQGLAAPVDAPNVAGILANASDNDEELVHGGNPGPHSLGKGRRQKQMSYKIKPNTNFLPSSTLPASLFPADSLLTIPPLPQRQRPAEELAVVADGTNSLLVSKFKSIRTPTNTFGLSKVFKMHESGDLPHDPDNSILPEDLREDQTLPLEENSPADTDRKLELYPFANVSSYRIGEWFWSDDGVKSQRSFHQLLDIIGSEDFNPADIRNANWSHIDRVLASSCHDVDDLDSKQWVDEGISWKSTPVTVSVPLSRYTGSPGNHPFTVEGFHYRPLVPIIRAKLESSAGREYFHTLGHELHWKPGEGKERVRVYGEMYNSPVFIQAYEEIQKLPPEPGCSLPRHVIGLMFASDSTMLATFGTAKLWPLYMFYANESKYRRSKPTEKLFETVAYFEKFPDSFKDFLVDKSGKPVVSQPLVTHCQRELFHEQWRHLLDEEFVQAYCHGIVVKCYDGISRRFYPRIFTYSADYPEKILLASIKNLGAFPCPRCHVQMKDVPAMGKKRDRLTRGRTARIDDPAKKKRIADSRSLIYEDHHPVNSTILTGHLAEGSLVPTDNAFSDKLSRHGFNLYKMLVVDVMHEVEIGAWKAVFIQLLRLLYASEDKGALNTLDARYRSMPTFGKGTIRRFHNNVSEMKQLAARDLEDLLQCAAPAFEGLISGPDDSRVCNLLRVFAHWHGLVKLRMHTDHTLVMLDELTTELGDTVRDFVKNTCSKTETKELPREYQARKRRELRQKANKGKPSKLGLATKRQKVSGGNSQPTATEEEEETSSSLRKSKTLNLNTYKFHSLGDMVSTIREFGTTDSYSTQIPEGFHRYPKVHYKRTSRKDVSRQLSRIQMRQARIRKLRKQLLPDLEEGYVDEDASQLPYFIGKSQSDPIDLVTLLQGPKRDPATKDFLTKLRKHLLPRVYAGLLQEAQSSGGDDRDVQRIQSLQSLVNSTDRFDSVQPRDMDSDAERIFFHSDRIYRHNILHINYTSYDVRRETDIVNPKTSRRDVMCLRVVEGAPETGEPLTSSSSAPQQAPHRFVHARVLGIFHTNVIYRGTAALDLRKRRFDFLLVRWYQFVQPMAAHRGLDRLTLSPLSDAAAIGFIDPADVLRASHVIPRYSLDRLYPNENGLDRLYPSMHKSDRIVSKLARDWEDWTEYYANRFVDRDMLMRYLWGHGVGHLYSHCDAPERINHSETTLDKGSSDVHLPQGLEDKTDPNSQSSADPTLWSDEDSEGDHEDALDDLQGEELDLNCGTESDASNTDLPEPDDEEMGW